MSRHQAYRNYDYEQDLDEYEGADGEQEGEELSPEDRGMLATSAWSVVESMENAEDQY